MKYIAHRGDHISHPENSLHAIKEAILDPNWDGVEFDIRFTSDNICVVFHDESTQRMCGKHYLINKTNFKVINKLSFLSHKDDRIPTLKDVLETIQHTDKVILIEIKDVLTSKQRQILINLLHEYPMLNFCLISFQIENKINTFPFSYLSSKLTINDLELINTYAVKHINVDYTNHSKEELKKWIQKGLQVSIWTNDVSDADYEAIGITYFTSNTIKKRTS